MKVKTPCSTKGCKVVHIFLASYRPGAGYTAPTEPCFECAEKTARKVAADDFLNRKRKTI